MPNLPPITTSFGQKFEMFLAEFKVVSLEDPTLVEATVDRPVQRIARASLTDVAWTSNYMHNLGENLFEMHLKACLYLGDCNGSTNVRMILAPWEQRGPSSMNLTQNAPYMAECLGCFTQQPVLHFGHPSTHVRACACLCWLQSVDGQLTLCMTCRMRSCSWKRLSLARGHTPGTKPTAMSESAAAVNAALRQASAG